MSAEKTSKNSRLLFKKKQLYFIFAGLFILGLGYLLMMGGRRSSEEFNPAALFSFTRITLSPLLILSGFFLMGWGIIKRS